MTRLAAAAALLAGLAGVARAAPPASFALVVGVNRSPEPDLQDLRYADDDAARYADLFRALGARTYLLSRLDENSARVHPQAAAEARPAAPAELEKAVAAIAEDVAQARSRGIPTVFYFAYAGHGRVRDGRALLAIEDGSLSAADLSALAARVNADAAHLVVDACYSYLLAFGRGPGGERRALAGFSDTPELAADGRTGLLLSTSSARESHEWEGVQAGVFSHEIRSGLYGAADADGDGIVSYREMASFVERANAAIPNEKFRPQVYARAPKSTWRLADLRSGLQRRLDVEGVPTGHYELESAAGVRLADFHNGEEQPVRLVRPAAGGALYVRRSGAPVEYAVAPGDEAVVSLAGREPAPARETQRGAAHEAYGLLFSLPFDRGVVEAWSPAPAPLSAPRRWQTTLGRGLLAGAAVAGTTSAWTWLAARGVADGASPRESHADIVARNARIGRYNAATTSLLSTAGLAAALGAGLLLWPAAPAHVGPAPGGAAVRGTF